MFYASHFTHGISQVCFLPLESTLSLPILLAVGAMRPQKGYDVLLEAAKLLKDRDAKYILLIAGDGPLWNEVSGISDRLGLQDKVILLGKRNDIPELLYAADIFVSSSNSEGMPISVIEAMICGKPIISTAVDGTRELIRNGVDGILVKPKDPEALASAAARLIDHPTLGSELGMSAQKRALDSFSMPVMVEKMLALYQNVLIR